MSALQLAKGAGSEANPRLWSERSSSSFLGPGGASDYSNQAFGVLPTAPPAAPIGLVAMYWADEGPWEGVSCSTDASSTSCRDTGLVAGKHYVYSVTATYPQSWNYDFYNSSWAGISTPP
jgi:hypothetical protein